MHESLLDRMRSEWWWRVSRHFTEEALLWKLAWMVPRRLALMVFVRVYAADGEEPGPDYERCYKAWQAGKGK